MRTRASVLGACVATLVAACQRPPAASSANTHGTAGAEAPMSSPAAGKNALACENPTADHAHVPVVPSAAPIGPAVARHVIILSEDGLRPDALALAGAKEHDIVMREGAYTLHAKTIRHASTLPAHAAMLSGFDVPDHGLFWNSWRPERGFIKVPTILSAAEQAGKGAAAFVGKWKLQHIAYPGMVDLFSRPGYLCKKVVEEASEYFVNKRPQVLFVHFSDPDDEGHAVGWMSDEQMKAVRASDRCLGTLMTAIRESPDAHDTLLIISADHGGHGRNHSGSVSEDRLIPWIAWGAGVRMGHRLTAAVSTVDTAATALWALGYPMPAGIEGRPVKEAFTAEAQGADPAR